MVAPVIRGPRTILALLTALNLLNYLDRFVLSAVLGSLQEDLHVSSTLGGALATVFLIGYFATSPIFGSMADLGGRGARKRLIAVGIVVWSLATIATGLASGPAALVAARAFVGVGEASYATIAPTIIDDIAPAKDRGRWLAVFYAAMPIGSALGYIVGGTVLTATHDWRIPFFVAGGPGLLLAFLCLMVEEPERTAAPAAPKPFTEHIKDLLESVQELGAIPAYRLTILGYALYTFALGGFAYWAPTYLHVRYGVETGRAASTFGLITVVTGIAGTLLGGWMGDRWMRGRSDDPATTRASLLVCMISAGLGAPLALAAILAPTSGGFYLAVIPAELALFLSGGPVNAAVLRSVPAGLRARAMALSIFAIHLLGDLWSPLLIGAVADHAPMAWAMLAAPAFFVLAALYWRKGVATVRLTQAVAVG
jgi:MFS transporter, Spinster family, sphingosine-1-phosphate transporter